MAGRGGYQDPSAAMGMMASAMMMQAMGGGRGGGRGAGASADDRNEKGEMICFNWRDYGRCRNGDQCRFAHSKPKGSTDQEKKDKKKKKKSKKTKKDGIVNSDISSSNSSSESESGSGGSNSDVDVVDFANMEEKKDGACVQVWDKKKVFAALLEDVKNDSGEKTFRWRITITAPCIQDRSVLFARYLCPEALGPDDKPIGVKGCEKYIQEILEYLSGPCGLTPADLPLKAKKDAKEGSRLDRLENILDRMAAGYEKQAQAPVMQTPRGKGTGLGASSAQKKSPVTPLERRARKQRRHGSSAASSAFAPAEGHVTETDLGNILGEAEEPDFEPENSGDEIEEDPPPRVLPGFPAAVDRNELVQAWKKIETLGSALDEKLKDYKQVSPSRLVVFTEATAVDESMNWMRPERPAGAGDIVKSFGPISTPEDFQKTVDQTATNILATMKNLQKPTIRLGAMLSLYGVTMTGKQTFKRLLMACGLVISRNAREVVERQNAAQRTPA